jgi:hypothetical protein
MAGVRSFSDKVIDYATRLSDVADAAQGRRRAGSGLARWTLLPASGAALVALVRSDFFAQQAKEVMRDAKSFASDLPDDLMSVVRQTAASGSRTRASQTSGSAGGSAASSGKTAGARKTSASKPRTSTSRKRTASSR